MTTKSLAASRSSASFMMMTAASRSAQHLMRWRSNPVVIRSTEQNNGNRTAIPNVLDSDALALIAPETIKD